MEEFAVYELTPEYEEFSGGNVSLVGGEMFDVGDALDKGDGRIVLAPGARANDEGEVSEAEAIRAARDSQIVDALAKYPAVVRTESRESDAPPSYDEVDITIDSDSTVTELRSRASELDIPGRSTMDKAELAEAIAAKEAELAKGEETVVDDGQTVGDDDESAEGDGDDDDGEGSDA